MIARIAIRTSRPLCLRYTSTAASTTSPTPAILLKIREDLKTAMRNKDQARLSVVRSLLTTIQNASKTSNPITTPSQVLSLLNSSISKSRDAANSFIENKRVDLAEKEEEQIRVLESLKGEMDVVGEEEIRRVVGEVVGEMQGGSGVGDVLKRVFGEGRGFGDGLVDRGEVARVVKEVLKEREGRGV